MGIKKYIASADNTIVNTYKPDLQKRATGSNTGRADIIEVYSIYGRQSSGSQELSRILLNFPILEVKADRNNGIIPSQGNVSFYLKLCNAEHSKTVPESFTLVASAISRSWQEGVGLDLETYKDETRGNEGSNWVSASNTTAWTSVGGDYRTGASYEFSQDFETGLEDLEINITSMVEKWIGNPLPEVPNFGIGVRLSSSFEAYFSSSTGQDSGSVVHNPNGATKSYYTKRFFARGSQYFFKRPAIEARWNDRVLDDRGNFFYSSSLAPANENLNTLFLYNYVRGVLTNIPSVGTGSIFVDLYSGSDGPTGSALIQSVNTPATGGYVSTGIYSCSVCLTAASTPLTRLYDVWHSGGVEFFTGSIEPKVLSAAMTVTKPVYFINITNNRGRYRSDETARFNLYIRNKFWNPTIYTVADTNPPTTTIESASYRVYRTIDGYEAIPYGTGSDLHTLLSHDVSGNYFNFDMSLLQPGYEYAFKFSFYESSVNSWSEQPETFTFRVEEYEY